MREDIGRGATAAHLFIRPPAHAGTSLRSSRPPAHGQAECVSMRPAMHGK